MGDHYESDALRPVHLSEKFDHMMFGFLIEVAGRFVSQDDRGVIHESPYQGNTTLLSSGQLFGIGVDLICQTDHAEQFFIADGRVV
jgi:hypothetical protein